MSSRRNGSITGQGMKDVIASETMRFEPKWSISPAARPGSVPSSSVHMEKDAASAVMAAFQGLPGSLT